MQRVRKQLACAGGFVIDRFWRLEECASSVDLGIVFLGLLFTIAIGLVEFALGMFYLVVAAHKGWPLGVNLFGVWTIPVNIVFALSAVWPPCAYLQVYNKNRLNIVTWMNAIVLWLLGAGIFITIASLVNQLS